MDERARRAERIRRGLLRRIQTGKAELLSLDIRVATKIEALKSRLTSLETDVDILKNKANAMAIALEGLRTDVDNLNSRVTELEHNQ